MRKLWPLPIAAILAVGIWSNAQSQGNPTCPTRPPADNSNACASTAFVQRAVTSGGVQSLNGLVGILSLVGGSGITSTPTSATAITITDTTTIVGGTGISATRVGAQFQVTNTGVTSIQSQTGALTVAAGVTQPGAVIKWDPQYAESWANCSIQANVSGNALTVSLKDGTGAALSATSPCTVRFRSASTAAGSDAYAITSATSFTTGTSGSTFGSSANVPLRLWVTLHNNNGVFLVGVSNRSDAFKVYPLDTGVTQAATSCNACTNATLPGTFYANSSLSGKAAIILGYLEWTSGLATAGSWSISPTGATMFTRDIKKPGDVVQLVTAISQRAATTAGAAYNDFTGSANSAPITAIITPTSRVNLVKARVYGTITTSSNSVAEVRIFRTSTQVGNAITFQTPGSGTAMSGVLFGLDRVMTNVGVTYGVQGLNSSGTLSFPAGNDGTAMELEEIQG